MTNQKVYANKNLQIIFSVTLIAVMGVASITPAFPQIAAGLNLTTSQVGLLITVFTLPGVVLTPLLGAAADRYGRKVVLVPALFLFSAAGTACFFAASFDILLLFRLFQGIGAASLGSLNVTLVSDLFAGKERAAAMGYNSSVLSIGTASYPAVGGALAALSWQAPFLLPILALPAGLIVLFKLEVPYSRNEQRLKEYFKSALTGINRKEIAGIFLISVITFIILYGSYLTFLPFLLHRSFNASPVIIGLMMSAMSLTTAITSTRLGRLAARYSELSLLKAAFIFYVVSLILIPIINSIWFLLMPIVLFGVAQGINIPGIQTLLANYSPAGQRAMFMSINGMVLRLGQTLGPLIAGAFYSAFGLSAAFWGGAVLAALTIGIIIFFIKPGPSDTD